ncbi:UDP-N-acetylmuramoyl-tripeptide--D-alanyl-D-alanine ligase [bacterium]|nr:UDP-N-acetylmuramoyl-tripeptide--D-alanyl-D-alanine ligase [bacterium]
MTDFYHLRSSLGRPRKLGELAAMTTGQLLPRDGSSTETVVGGLASDSRAVQSGDLFCALVGERVDGHRYLKAVAKSGAAAVLVSKETENYPLPQLVVVDVRVAMLMLAAGFRESYPAVELIGVTGSVGKTTTRDYLAAILAEVAPTLSSAANLNTEVGVPLTLARLTAEHRFAVVEMGMQWAGEITALAKAARPRIGIVTTVGAAHLEFFDDVAGIARAKAELIAELPKDGLAILPAENEYLNILKESAICLVVTFGLSEGDCRATEVETTSTGSRFTVLWEPPAGVVSKATSFPVELATIGQHQPIAALPAIATALLFEATPEQIQSGLRRAKLTAGRGEIIHKGKLTIIDDAYNANPLSMNAALETLAGLPGERKIAVLGDMLELGETAPELHREVGRKVAELEIDLLLAVGEYKLELGEGAFVDGMDEVYSAEDTAAALRFLLKNLRAGDIVLLKASNALGLSDLIEKLPEL